MTAPDDQPDKSPKAPDITPEPIQPQQQPNHLAVPLPVMQEVMEILQELPYKQVQRVLPALATCHPITLTEK